MIEPSEIDQLRLHFRISGPLSIERVAHHLVGKVFFLKGHKHEYLAQLYETIHTNSQIQTDLDLLRNFSNHGFNVPIPLISVDGNSFDTKSFHKPCALFAQKRDNPLPLFPKQLSKVAAQLAEMEKIVVQRHSSILGKKIDAIFTMFELLSQEEKMVEETFISEYFAFKSSYIELINSTRVSCFGFFPGKDIFFLSKDEQAGFTHRSFIYDHPRLFGLAQLILSTCFNDDGSIDYDKLDGATSGYARESSCSSNEWDLLDGTLKTAAFFEVLCHWLATVYQPNLMHIDELIVARMKQKHLKKLRLRDYC